MVTTVKHHEKEVVGIFDTQSGGTNQAKSPHCLKVQNLHVL